MQVPLRGVQFHGAWFCHECEVGDRLTLEREPNNSKDRNAIVVLHEGRRLGYVGEEKAEELAPKMDAGEGLEAVFLTINVLWDTRTNGYIEVEPISCLT